MPLNTTNKWKNWLEKVCRIHENGVQNLQVKNTEFSMTMGKLFTHTPLLASHNNLVVVKGW